MFLFILKITIKDVAQRAGVSTATVSNVINESCFVKEETKLKVMSAIKQLNYHPDISARSFKTGKKYTVGLIVPEYRKRVFRFFY